MMPRKASTQHVPTDTNLAKSQHTKPQRRMTTREIELLRNDINETLIRSRKIKCPDWFDRIGSDTAEFSKKCEERRKESGIS